MNFNKKFFGKIILLTFIFLLPIISFAEFPSDCNPGDGKICNPLSGTATLPELIQKVLEGVLKIGIPVIALAIIYCGYLFVVARGNSEEINKAKEALLYTIIGSGILLGSWAIAKMISITITSLGS